MADSSGLLLAISLAERKRDEVIRALAQSQQNVQAAMGQLDQLRSYAGDTDHRWVSTGSVGLSVESAAPCRRHKATTSASRKPPVGIE